MAWLLAAGLMPLLATRDISAQELEPGAYRPAPIGTTFKREVGLSHQA